MARDLFAELRAAETAPARAAGGPASAPPPAPAAAPRAPAGRDLFAELASAGEQPGLVERAGRGIASAARAVGKAIVGEHEDYPEIPFGASDLAGNIETARTPEGRLNMLKKVYQAAEFAGKDRFGNRLVRLNQETPRGKADQLYYLNKPGASLGDIDTVQAFGKRFALPAATSIVMGPAGALPAVGAGLIAGGASEAMGQGEAAMGGAQEGVDLPRIGTAALANAAGEGIGRGISWALEKAARAVMQMSGAVDDGTKALIVNGQPTPELAQALKARGMTMDDLTAMARQELTAAPGALSPDDAVTAAEFKALGIEPTKGQLTRNFGDFAFERETAKSITEGAPIRERFAQQNRQLLKALDDVKTGTGGQGDDAFKVGQTTKTALRAKNAAAENTVRQAYRDARAAAGDTPVPFDKLTAELEEAGDYVGLVPQLDVVKRRLARYGVLDPEGKPIGGMTVERAELLRREISDLRGNDPTQQMVMDRLKRALDDDVTAAVGDDTFGAARKAASERFSEFVNKKTAGIVRKLVDDGVADEDVITGVVQRWKFADLKRVKNSLTTGNTRQGAAAWVDMRAGVVKWLADQSTAGRAMNELGDPVFSGANMAKAMEKIGMPKLRLLFSEDELRQLNQIRRIGERITSAPPGSVNYSGTSAALWNKLNAMADKIPIPGSNLLLGLIKSSASGRAELKTAARAAQALDPVKAATDQAAREAARAVKGARVLPKVGVGTAQSRERAGE